MQAIKCELCGSNQLIKKDGFFQCEHCGTKYTLEEAKKLIVSGTVEVTKGEAEKNRLLNNIRFFINNHDFKNAKKTIDVLNFDYPNDEDVKHANISYRIEFENYKLRKEVDNNILFLEQNISNVIPPHKLFPIIDILVNNKTFEYRLEEYGNLLKEYYQNFSKIVHNITLSKINTYRSWDVHCTPDTTGLPEEFIVWIYFDSNLFTGRYSNLLSLQETATDFYYSLILKGNVRPTSYGKIYRLRDDYLLGYESFDHCEVQWESAFGACITKEYYKKDHNVNDVPIKNIFLRKYFLFGIREAKRINQEYSIPKDRKLYFVLGAYSFRQDGFSSDYGPPLKYCCGFDEQNLLNHRKESRKMNGVCQYCGCSFKGLLKKVCSKCGKPKDY